MGKRLLFVLSLLGLVAPCFGQEERQRRRPPALAQEEATDYFQKWLEEDVVYIITEEEREVFLKLQTDEEREAFIEQFWFRRDPDPRTQENEYKEEHYRRIAYANEKFGSGIPGWKTDRGRVYITFGPPDIIEDHPSGGWYYRPAHEGGGATSTYPFQIWIYNFIEGIGDQVEIEFVDPSWSGEYRMALEPWEKDALLHVGFMGPTDAELEGRLSKLDRPYFSPGNYRNTKMQRRLGMRMRDKPFEKIIRYYRLQQPISQKYQDLKQLVTTQVLYHQVPFQLSYNYLTIDERQALVLLTLELSNRDLTFDTSAETVRGQVNIYGVIQGLTGKIVAEFEDTLQLEFPPQLLQEKLARRSVYQKGLLLEPGRYKLTLALKDDHSDRVGTLEKGILVPPLGEGLDASSLILARALQWVEEVPETPVPFVLGDVKVIPNVERRFHPGDDLGLYLQIYHAGFDQATQQPALEVEYQILREGRIVKSFLDPKQNSVLNYGDRLVLVHAFDLQDLSDGTYTLNVKVRDRIRQQELQRRVDFRVGG